MRISRRLRTLLLGCTLAFSAFVGTPVLPEDIENLMRSMHSQKIEYVLPGGPEKPGLPPLDEDEPAC